MSLIHTLTENAGKYPTLGEKEWYFFTPRDRKYKNGTRPNRAAGSGYWKATGADRLIKYQIYGVIGYRKALVYYEGRPPKGHKTNWIMHEYRVKEDEATTSKSKPRPKPPCRDGVDSMRVITNNTKPSPNLSFRNPYMQLLFDYWTNIQCGQLYCLFLVLVIHICHCS